MLSRGSLRGSAQADTGGIIRRHDAEGFAEGFRGTSDKSRLAMLDFRVPCRATNHRHPEEIELVNRAGIELAAFTGKQGKIRGAQELGIELGVRLDICSALLGKLLVERGISRHHHHLLKLFECFQQRIDDEGPIIRAHTRHDGLVGALLADMVEPFWS